MVPPAFSCGVHLFMPPIAIGLVPSLSGHAIAYRRRSLPTVLKVVPATGAAFSGYHHGPINVRLSFPTPTINIGTVCGHALLIVIHKVSEASQSAEITTVGPRNQIIASVAIFRPPPSSPPTSVSPQTLDRKAKTLWEKMLAERYN